MPKYMETELGQEKLCHDCGDWWPNAAEFYGMQSQAKDGRLGTCKACMTSRAYWKGSIGQHRPS